MFKLQSHLDRISPEYEYLRQLYFELCFNMCPKSGHSGVTSRNVGCATMIFSYTFTKREDIQLFVMTQRQINITNLVITIV